MRSTRTFACISPAVLSLALAMPASGLAAPQGGMASQAEQSPAKQEAAGLSAADRAFVLEAAKGGMMEVELGKLATERASSDEVKRFGQRMVDDHSKANQQLMKVAEQKSVTLPAEHGGHEGMAAQLASLSGDEFDRAYMKRMVQDHQKDVKAFDRQAKSGRDGDVKAFAQSTLPTLQEHLKEAQRIAVQLGTSRPAKASKPISR